MDAIHQNCKDVPVILLGLKRDTCTGVGMQAPVLEEMMQKMQPKKPENEDFVIMRAIKYIECSAKNGKNVDHVFEEGIRMVLAERDEQIELAFLRMGNSSPEPTGLAKLSCFK
ncbi:hypothetical protein F4804DRAFT_327610 [Jackrogersella minutella]|nr:hypothetical protein F4804DRAFT_327610 [Jackrogersella minutella]